MVKRTGKRKKKSESRIPLIPFKKLPFYLTSQRGVDLSNLRKVTDLKKKDPLTSVRERSH
jgi:hypothetical protein